MFYQLSEEIPEAKGGFYSRVTVVKSNPKTNDAADVIFNDISTPVPFHNHLASKVII